MGRVRHFWVVLAVRGFGGIRDDDACGIDDNVTTSVGNNSVQKATFSI